MREPSGPFPPVRAKVPHKYYSEWVAAKMTTPASPWETRHCQTSISAGLGHKAAQMGRPLIRFQSGLQNLTFSPPPTLKYTHPRVNMAFGGWFVRANSSFAGCVSGCPSSALSSSGKEPADV